MKACDPAPAEQPSNPKPAAPALPQAVLSKQSGATSSTAAIPPPEVLLSPVVAVSPELREPPQITRENVLRLAGYFPTKPLQVQFQLLFQPVNGQWRLLGMAVDVAAPIAQAATPSQKEKKDKK